MVRTVPSQVETQRRSRGQFCHFFLNWVSNSFRWISIEQRIQSIKVLRTHKIFDKKKELGSGDLYFLVDCSDGVDVREKSGLGRLKNVFISSLGKSGDREEKVFTLGLEVDTPYRCRMSDLCLLDNFRESFHLDRPRKISFLPHENVRTADMEILDFPSSFASTPLPFLCFESPFYFPRINVVILSDYEHSIEINGESLLFLVLEKIYSWF